MRTRENLIQIRTTETEYKRISENAKKLNMKLAPYVRMVAQNPTIIRYNYDALIKHTREIANIRKDINRIIFTIEATNNYLPRDIERIVNYMQDLFESENQLLEELRNERVKQYEKNRRMAKKEETTEANFKKRGEKNDSKTTLL